MTYPIPVIGGTLGVQPDQELVRVMNRTTAARVVGDLVMFDLGSTDGATTTSTIGATTSVFVNVILPATAGLLHGWFGIVTIAGADNAAMTVCLRGVVQANVSGGNAAAVTDLLAAVNSQDNLDSDALTGGEKILGIPLETTAGATEELISVLFDGIHGFGNAAES